MELRCPSCGNKHLTEDYPDAFEIQCSCGYSLLVPEIASEIVSPQALDSMGFASLPGAVEVQDEANKIKLDPSSFADPLLNVPKLDDALTPPEELPPEMPYDRFELQDTPKVDAAPSTESAHFESSMPEEIQSSEQNLGESSDSDPEEVAFTDMVFAQSTRSLNQKAPELPESEVNQETAPLSPEIASSAENPIAEELVASVDTHAAPAQEIIQRAQLASLGQLIGSSFNLKWSDFDSGKAMEFQKRCEQVVSPRPWLAAELKKRGIQIENISRQATLENVPEILALEIFMAAYELGGQCEFTQS